MTKSIKKENHVQAMMTDDNTRNMNRYQAKHLMKGERIGKSTIVNRALTIFFAQHLAQETADVK